VLEGVEAASSLEAAAFLEVEEASLASISRRFLAARYLMLWPSPAASPAMPLPGL
jgi:hypothetical protein